VLGEALRRWGGLQLQLHGLSEQETRRYVALTTNTQASDALAARLHHDTRGNPLFVAELLRLLAAEGRLDAPRSGLAFLPSVPPSIGHIIGRRLDRLSSPCLDLLTFAAVLGGEFDLAALAHAGTPGEAGRERMLVALEEAEAARLVSALPGTPGRYSFSHPLFRETLYSQLLTRERVRLHRRAAEALERVYLADIEAHPAELAYHYLQAAPAGGAERAVDYARQAAARAVALFAYEEAVRWCGAALQALPYTDLAAEAQRRKRCDLLLALGEAQTRSGQTDAAKETFLTACGLARDLGLANEFARGALGYGGYRGSPGLVDAVLVALLEEAAMLGEQGSTPPSLRARVLARLAMELYSGGEEDRRDRLSAEAVALARGAGDRAALAAALIGRHYALHGPDNTAERLAAADELVGLAEGSGENELALQGHYLRVIDALELGDSAAVEASIAAHVRRSEDVRQPLYLWRSDLLLGMRALLEGRLDEAERLIRRAFEVSQRAQIANSLAAYGTQMLVLSIETGGVEALEDPQRSRAEQYPQVTAYRVGLALIFRVLERAAEARIEFERLAQGDFAAVLPDDNFFTSMAALAEVCCYLGDQPRAAALYARLQPYAGRVVVLNAAIACLGSVDRYLGLLASVLGRVEEASQHFEHALTRNAALGARPQLAHTQYDLAALLIRRAAPGDSESAATLLAQAEATAEALGLKVLRTRIGRLRQGVRGHGVAAPAAAGAGLSAREREVLRLLVAGRTNHEIAASLVLSSRTVDHHIQAIYRKIGVRRRVDAVAYALRVGLAAQ
jgi:DNA-binding CsgD family transcriptional regulator